MPYEEKRPVWPHEIPISQARFLVAGFIEKVMYRRRIYDADKCESWVELTNMAGKSIKFRKDYGLRFEFNIWGTGGLLKLNSHDRTELLNDIQKIDLFDTKYENELAEYKRLKERFGDA